MRGQTGHGLSRSNVKNKEMFTQGLLMLDFLQNFGGKSGYGVCN